MAAPRWITQALRGLTAAHQRVRAAMYLVLGSLLVIATLQWHSVERHEREQQVHHELLSQALSQQSLTESMARIAAVGALSSSNEDLAAALEQAQASALRLEALFNHEHARSPLGAELQHLRQEWLRGTEVLWYRAEMALGRLGDPGAELKSAVEALQGAAEPALAASKAMKDGLNERMQSTAEAAEKHWRATIAATVLLLLVATLFVVEPMVRAVERQHRLLEQQSAQLQHLLLAVRHANTGFVITDAQQRTVWMNEAFERQRGQGPTQLMGQALHHLLREDLDEPSSVNAKARLDASEGFRCESRRQRPDGSVYWVDLDVRPWRDAAGQVQGLVCAETDISERVAQRQQLAALLAALPVGVLVHDESGAIVDCNPAAAQMLQLSHAQVLRLKPQRLARHLRHDDGRAWTVEELPPLRTLASGEACDGAVLGYTNGKGDSRWLYVQTQWLLGADGRPGCLSCFTDITEQKVQQQLLSLTVNGSGIGLWQWDIRSNAMQSNERMYAMLGYRAGQVGQHLRDWVSLVHEDDRERWFAGIQAHLADPQVPYAEELRILCADGRYASVMSNGVVVERDAQGEPTRMAGIHMDVTEQTRLREQLRRGARHDHLTGLPNRAAVLERIGQALARWRGGEGSRFAVLFMDFDRFKQVNDRLGHAAGDELLRQVAQRLQGALRPGDALSRVGAAGATGGAGGPAGPQHTAARLGGDEFVVVLEGLKHTDDAQQVAQRLVNVLSQPYVIEGSTVHSSASIGIVNAEDADADAEGVLRDADTAMYEAKRLGKGCQVAFAPEMRELSLRKNSLEADLRDGLGRNELHVVFQPVVSLSDGGLRAVEALARWTHPQRGAVSPVEFIAVAEESGLIGEVGQFVLQEACASFAQMRQQLGARAPQLLAVNLSRAQLKRPELHEQVRSTLASTGLPPSALQLEVTESLAAQDDQVQQSLRALKALGVKLALDDFGTGYSSLACLHLLPVDTVKIDRSFVRHAESSEHHRVLIEATIRVARSLGMDTVAEGVETPGQALLLHSLDCDKGQGWLFSKPLEAPALMRWAQGEAQAAAA
jgi:PAS domain S-box-containing protein